MPVNTPLKVLPVISSSQKLPETVAPPLVSMSDLRQRKTAGESEKETPLPGGGPASPAFPVNKNERGIWLFFIRCIIAFIPTRWNAFNLEIGMTHWENRLRVYWLDSGLYKRKLVWASVMFVFVLVALTVSSTIPWRLLLRTDVEQVYTDTRGREIHNILVPRLIDPKKDASDAQIADQIIRGGAFRELTPQVVKQGYTSVRESNISLDMLRSKLIDVGRRYPCLCAAHMGVPLNVIVFSPKSPRNEPGDWGKGKGERGKGTRERGIEEKEKGERGIEEKEKGEKGDPLFMVEPSPTGATGRAVTSGKMQSNLDPGNPFQVVHPSRMTVKYLTMSGLVDRTELRGDNAACAVWCIELAWKEQLVDEKSKSILSQRPRQIEDNKGGLITEHKYVGFG